MKTDGLDKHVCKYTGYFEVVKLVIHVISTMLSAMFLYFIYSHGIFLFVESYNK